MIKPATKQAMRLFHDGALVFAEMEHNGIRVDVPYLDSLIHDTHTKLKKIKTKLTNHKLYEVWRKRFGQKTKIGSREQLAVVLFEVLEYPITKRTPSGEASGDEEHISTVDLGFVKGYLKYQKLLKMSSTYLANIKRETMNGFLHPFFNLHLTVTYRSSSDHINWQNIPIRNPEIGPLIRKCFIPREGHHIIEIDFSGIEVRVAACYHKDPKMLDYINDKSTDMHRDMAAQIYKLDTDQVEKNVRHSAKNMFVFPQFYGDFYINCAKNMWASIGKENLKVDGVCLYEHLKDCGIYKLGECSIEESPKNGTFEKHMQEVEKDFWGNRFQVYDKWKKKFWNKYQADGGFNTLTGFRVEGDYRKNEVINNPIQGSAFHCLLWCAIRVNKILKKYKMKSVLVGQIHDSLISDVHKNEKANYLEISHKVMTKDLKKHFPWLIVPIEVEAEVTPLNGSWAEKKAVEL